MDNRDGRAATLWRLRARHTTAQCVLQPLPVGALLTLLQDNEVVFHETFPDTQLAEARADALRTRLEAKGWRAVPITATDRDRRRGSSSRQSDVPLENGQHQHDIEHGDEGSNHGGAVRDVRESYVSDKPERQEDQGRPKT
jgi:hypothetical protein